MTSNGSMESRALSDGATPLSDQRNRLLQSPVLKFANFYAPRLSQMHGLPLDEAYNATIRSLLLLQSRTFKKDCRVWLHKSSKSKDEMNTQYDTSLVNDEDDNKRACQRLDDSVNYKKDSRVWLHKSSARYRQPNANHFRLESNFAANVLATPQMRKKTTDCLCQRDSGCRCDGRPCNNEEQRNVNCHTNDNSLQQTRGGGNGDVRPSVSEAEYPSEVHAMRDANLNRQCISNPALRSADDNAIVTDNDPWKLQRNDRRGYNNSHITRPSDSSASVTRSNSGTNVSDHETTTENNATDILRVALQSAVSDVENQN